MIGGNTAASQRNQHQTVIDSALEPSAQRNIDRTLAPACQASYYGCR